jgi:hypothetical protein
MAAPAQQRSFFCITKADDNVYEVTAAGAFFWMCALVIARATGVRSIARLLQHSQIAFRMCTGICGATAERRYPSRCRPQPLRAGKRFGTGREVSGAKLRALASRLRNGVRPLPVVRGVTASNDRSRAWSVGLRRGNRGVRISGCWPSSSCIGQRDVISGRGAWACVPIAPQPASGAETAAVDLRWTMHCPPHFPCANRGLCSAACCTASAPNLARCTPLHQTKPALRANHIAISVVTQD